MSARPLLYGRTGVYPQFVSRAEGCRFVDTTGGVYVDWVVGWGSALLGYRRPEVESAIRDQTHAAATLTLPSPLEVEVAERIVEFVPCAEMVAFAKNGSDAVTAAVRLARAVTERDVILQYGFHGFHDWFAAEDRAIRGIPASFRGLVHPFPYNDLAALEALFARHRHRVAAVLMEPFRTELPKPGYLEAVRDLAKRHDALLIFDEMITGFRVAPGGGQEVTGVVPDLACLGKALSNGMPLSALVGPRSLMSGADSVGVDMGARGETLSLASARAALDLYADGVVARRTAEVGRALSAGLEAAARRERVPIRIPGHPARLEVEFDDVGRLPGRAALGLFVQGCLDRGVVTNGLLFPTSAHDGASIDQTVRAAREALHIVRLAADGRTAALPPPFGPTSVGFLDSAEVAGGELRIYGWILPAGGPPDEVELIDSDGRTVTAASFSRPDVARAYPSVRGAERSGWWASIPVGSEASGATWTLRARRGGQVAFRCRLVSGVRSYKRSFPRELSDGCVAEI